MEVTLDELSVTAPSCTTCGGKSKPKEKSIGLLRADEPISPGANEAAKGILGSMRVERAYGL